MTNHEAEPNAVLPNPEEIARRVALITQDSGVSPDIEFDPDTRQEVYFGLADDRRAGAAVVRLSRFSRFTRLHNGQEVPEWSGGRYAHIGHYDPAQQNWMLYPEYVMPNEQQALSTELEQQADISHSMLMAEAQAGKPFADLRHPLTMQVRKEMAEILRSTGIASRLIADNPTDFFGDPRRSDEFTTYTLALTPKLSGPGVGTELCSDDAQRNDPSQYGMSFDQTLTVAYDGLILDRNGSSTRAHQYVHIASRSMDDENVWMPDLTIITPDEWDALSHVPKALLGYKHQDPKFSAELCAIVLHYDH